MPQEEIIAYKNNDFKYLREFTEKNFCAAGAKNCV